MRFHFGVPPEDETFDPQAEGWLPIREPVPRVLMLIAIPVAIGLFLLWGVLCFLVFPVEQFVPEIIPISEKVIQIQIPIVASILETSIWPFLTILILFIPIHELIHALCFPDRGLSSRTFIGVWPSRGFFYAHYEGSMPRNRFLLVLAAPFIALSLMPITLIAGLRFLGWLPEIMLSLAWLSLVNSLGAAGDLIGVWRVSSRIPRAAMVRNKGWKTYWKSA
jgi:Putative zincin peptidase